MADRIFTSGAEAAEAAHFPPRTTVPFPPQGCTDPQKAAVLWDYLLNNVGLQSCVARVHYHLHLGWEYQEVRFVSVRELDEFGKFGWEFFHIESQAGGYRKALGKRLCST